MTNWAGQEARTGPPVPWKGLGANHFAQNRHIYPHQPAPNIVRPLTHPFFSNLPFFHPQNQTYGPSLGADAAPAPVCNQTSRVPESHGAYRLIQNARRLRGQVSQSDLHLRPDAQRAVGCFLPRHCERPGRGTEGHNRLGLGSDFRGTRVTIDVWRDAGGGEGEIQSSSNGHRLVEKVSR